MAQNFSCFLSLTACLSLSILFVGSLYVWRSPYDRNHPTTIKKRFCSVFVVMLLSPVIMQQFIYLDAFKKVNLLELLGFRLPGLLSAATIPLFLTMTLFLGPLCMQSLSGLWRLYAEPMFWVSSASNLVWLRNHLVAPLSEEFTFRACMLPLLLQCFKPTTAVFICPLFFGFAHIHHMRERLAMGSPLNKVLILSAFEFSYTTLFGAYSALLFLKTGHFVAPFLAHAFCNLMGFPDFNEVLSYRHPKKTILICLFVGGVILWCLLFTPLTNHTLYSNELFWKVYHKQ